MEAWCYNDNEEHYKFLDMFCEMFDDGSDVAQLEILQEKLVSLNEKNFEETKIWILNSIFAKSEEAIHDLIYNFYLISAARVNDHKSSIFSRMIISLYEHRRTHKYLKHIKNQLLEIITLTNDMYVEDLIQELISSSIISESEVEEIEKQITTKELNRDGLKCYNYGLFLSQKLLYLHFSNEENEFFKLIDEDNKDGLLEEISETGKDIKETFQLFFDIWTFKFSMIDYAAFKGSVNCFKYLLINGAEISYNTLGLAITGGNIEIIRLLEQRNCDFSRCLIKASASFHNDVFDWLTDKPEVDLTIWMSTENIHALRYWIGQNLNVGVSFLSTMSIILTKYFLDCFGNDYIANLALKNACMTGNIGLVRYLCENYPSIVNYNQIFRIALIECKSDIIKYLRKSKNILYFDLNNDFYSYAIEVCSYNILEQLVEINEIEFSETALKRAIESDDQKIFEILWENDSIKQFFAIFIIISLIKCFETDSFVSFKNINDIDKSLQCFKVLFSSDIAYRIFIYRDVKIFHNYFDSIFGKIDANPSIYFEENETQWKNIHELEFWIFNKSCKIGIKNTIEYLFSKRNFVIDEEQFVYTLKIVINEKYRKKRYRDYNGGKKMEEYLIKTFKKYFIPNIIEIKRFCREKGTMDFIYEKSKYFYSYMTKEEKHEMLLYACRNRNLKIIQRYQDILPEYINTVKNNETLLTALLVSYFGQDKIGRMLLDVPGIDLSLSVYDLRFIQDRSGIIYRRFLELPFIDVNRYFKCYDTKATLIYYDASDRKLENFKAILNRNDVDVNKKILVTKNFEEFYYKNTLIHYLITKRAKPKDYYRKWNKNGPKTKMLKILLNYHSTDVNIKDANGCTALVLAIKFNKYKKTVLLLKHPNIDVNMICHDSDAGTCPLFEALERPKDILELLVERDDINLDISLSGNRNLRNLISKRKIREENLEYLKSVEKAKKYL